MKIVIATPLYPPDIAEPAPYAKELARRLGQEDEVTVASYTELPERIARVRHISVSKSRALPVRLFLYTRALWAAARSADIVYAQNGASVELPAALVALFTRTPLILGLSDEAAHARAQVAARFSIWERLSSFAAQKVISEMPPQRPEILPFGERPSAALAGYEESWRQHIKMLKDTFTRYGN